MEFTDPVSTGYAEAALGHARDHGEAQCHIDFLGHTIRPQLFRESNAASQCSIERYIPRLDLRALQKVAPGPQGRKQER